MIDLKVKHKTAKILEGNLKANLYYLWLCKSMVYKTKKIDEMDFIKIKNVCRRNFCSIFVYKFCVDICFHFLGI